MVSPGSIDQRKCTVSFLARALSAGWYLLLACHLLPPIRGMGNFNDAFSGYLALFALASSLHLSLVWLLLFVVFAVKRRGQVGKYMWLQAIILMGLEVVTGWVVSHP